MSKPRVLCIDHRDSFVFNLVDALARCGAQVRTIRADVKADVLQSAVAAYAPVLVVLSPGPGHPDAAHATLAWLRTQPRVPVLGVCLGHQAMAVALGGEVARAPQPVHGRASRVVFTDHPTRTLLPQPFVAGRYHSLVVTRVPAEFRVIATARDGDTELVMAMRHRTLPWLGVQFHPESVLTPYGDALLRGVLADALTHRPPRAEQP
jgi:anthranilate synthase/aminodeoxychorismate synthase-like glutamine amidotransferase